MDVRDKPQFSTNQAHVMWGDKETEGYHGPIKAVSQPGNPDKHKRLPDLYYTEPRASEYTVE